MTWYLVKHGDNCTLSYVLWIIAT